MKTNEQIREEIIKEYNRHYAKTWYQKNKEKVLAKLKALREDEEWLKKRKEYRRKYYELKGK